MIEEKEFNNFITSYTFYGIMCGIFCITGFVILAYGVIGIFSKAVSFSPLALLTGGTLCSISCILAIIGDRKVRSLRIKMFPKN
jgi:hypothetical protein